MINYLYNIGQSFYNFAYSLVWPEENTPSLPSRLGLDSLFSYLASFFVAESSSPKLGATPTLPEDAANLANEINNLALNQLFIAIKNCDVSTVQTALETQIDLHSKFEGETPVTQAALKPIDHPDKRIAKQLLNQVLEVIQHLIDKGADVNQTNDSGASPLLLAIHKQNKDISELLLKSKADPNEIIKHANYKGYSLLTKAIEDGNLAIIQLLLTYGAKINLADDNHKLPFELAIESAALVQLLIDHGVNINQENEEGLSPLILAIQHKNDIIAQFLIKEGADIKKIINKGPHTGKSAIDFVEKGSTIEKFLTEENTKPKKKKIVKLNLSP